MARNDSVSRTVARHGSVAAGAIALSLLMAACSSPVTGGANGDIGEPTDVVPTELYERWDEPGEVPDLPPVFALSMATAEGAWQTFMDAATTTAGTGGLETVSALSEYNAADAASQFDSFLQRGVSSMFVLDVDPASQGPLIEQAIDQGVGVTALNMPGTTQLTADQYGLGKQLAQATLDYIAEHLDNEAKLLHFNAEWVLPERERGWNEVMENRPDGVEIVANISANPLTQEYGNQSMTTALQKDPDINVVDGPDTVVLGALAALETAGKADNPDLALIGMDGDPQAVEAVLAGGPYKMTLALNIPILGALTGQWAADWSAGYNVPQLVVVPAVRLFDSASIDQYNADVEDPVAALEEAEGVYYVSYGSISYQTRGNYFSGSIG